MTDFNEIELDQYAPSPGAVAAGLMVEKNGEPHFTAAGLFAMSGSLSVSNDIDEQTRQHNVFAISRVLAVARAGGLDAQNEQFIHILFAEKVDPAGSSDKSKMLAVLCQIVALSVCKERMGDLIEGKKAH